MEGSAAEASEWGPRDEETAGPGSWALKVGGAAHSGLPGAQGQDRQEPSQVCDGVRLGHGTPLELRADSAIPPVAGICLLTSLPSLLCSCVLPGSLGDDLPRYRVILPEDYKAPTNLHKT